VSGVQGHKYDQQDDPTTGGNSSGGEPGGGEYGGYMGYRRRKGGLIVGLWGVLGGE
jgi:hypothetical protein